MSYNGHGPNCCLIRKVFSHTKNNDQADYPTLFFWTLYLLGFVLWVTETIPAGKSCIAIRHSFYHSDWLFSLIDFQHLKEKEPFELMRLLSSVLLLWNFAHLNAQCFGHPFAVGGIGLQAVADMADFNHLRRIVHCTSGVAKQGFLLFLAH